MDGDTIFCPSCGAAREKPYKADFFSCRECPIFWREGQAIEVVGSRDVRCGGSGSGRQAVA